MKKSTREKLERTLRSMEERIYMLDSIMQDSIIDEDFTKVVELQTRIHELSMVIKDIKNVLK